MIGYKEPSDGQDPSVDRILRELCLLRCSSCNTSSVTTTTRHGLNNQSYQELFRQLSLVRLKQNRTTTKEIENESDLFLPEQSELESIRKTRPLHNDQRTPVEYLLRKRCTSPDCACEKRTGFKDNIDLTEKSISLTSEDFCSRSVASQAAESSLGLSLGGWDGQIVIRENERRRRVRDSLESVPSILKSDCSSGATSSESVFTFLDHCSDPQLVSSLGFNRSKVKQRKVKTDMNPSNPSLPSSESKSKCQMIETYGKFIHKIEKLKKMASWKSKRRKKKMKFTLEGNDVYDAPEMDCPVQPREKNLKSSNEEALEGDGVGPSKCKREVGIQFEQKLTASGTDFESEIHEEQRGASDEDANAAGTCNCGSSQHHGQQGLNSNAADPIKTTQSVTRAHKSPSSPSSEGQVVKSWIDTDLKSTEKVKARREDSASQTLPMPTQTTLLQKRGLHYHNFSHGDSSSDFAPERSLDFHSHDEVSCTRDRETDTEILDHLKQINKILEGESCANCSLHRLKTQDVSKARNLTTRHTTSRHNHDKKDRFRNKDKCKQAKVYWAVTKVTVYPDSCRTYEVMRLSKRRPHKVPSSSDSVFVLLPNK